MGWTECISPTLLSLWGGCVTELCKARLQSSVNLGTEKLVMWRPLVFEGKMAVLQAVLKSAGVLCHSKLCLTDRTATCPSPSQLVSTSDSEIS